MAKLTLDEAISHALEVSKRESVCPDCRDEHRQLAEWLIELKRYRETFGQLLPWEPAPTPTPFGIPLTQIPDPCRGCPEHPSNGGSGICFCILGLPKIT